MRCSKWLTVWMSVSIAFILVLFLPIFISFLGEPKTTPMLRLIATPWLYHHQRVAVRGFLKLDFEAYVLFFHKEDYEHYLPNSVWIVLTNEDRARKKELDSRYVLVEGTFDASYGGKLGSWASSIKDVTRLEQWKGIAENTAVPQGKPSS